MQAEKYQFFLDISGSVGGSVNYWNTVNDLLTLYGPDVENYYFWDSHVQRTDKKTVEKYIKNKTGCNGTSP